MKNQVDDQQVQPANPIFIIGRQRSGTTVFRKLLEAEGAYDCDEIFHGDFVEPHRFYRFVLDRVRDDPACIHPEHHGVIFAAYMNWLKAKAHGKPLAIDVKYYGLNLIPAHEDMDDRQPFIFRYIAEQQAKTVFIKRNNKMRVFVSEKIAEMTSRWSARNESELVTQKPKLNINCDVAIRFIRYLIQQDKRVAQLLQPLPQIQCLIYEEMFVGDVFSGTTLKTAATVLEKSTIGSMPPMIKMNPEPLSTLIGNFDEVTTAFKDTEFAWMLEQN